MKQLSNSKLALLLIATIATTSCISDVDMNNIDPSAKVGMGLALPVGSLTLKLGDFIGDSTFENISINDKGIYQFQTTFTYMKEFHQIDLTRYLTDINSVLMMKQQVKEQYPSIPENPITGEVYIADTGQDIVLNFPIGLKFANINTNVDEERLDKMTIESAQFTSNFSQNFGLDFSRIKKLEIILPENMHRDGGQIVNIPLSGYDYGRDIPVIVDHFEINLLEDDKQPFDATSNPVTDSVTLTMSYTIRLNSGETITLDDNSAFDYNFRVSFIEYDALYGYFATSSEMRDKDEMDIGKAWEFWNSISEFTIPIAEPQLRLDLTTAIAAPLGVHIDTLQVEDRTKTPPVVHTATFKTSAIPTHYDTLFPKYLTVNDPLDARITNDVTFDKDNGNLDYIFEIRPDIVRYSYEFKPYDVPGIYQHRLTRDTKINVDATITVPFIFKEGTKLAFRDTVHVAMDSLSLQALTKDVDEIDSINVQNLKLVLTTQSYIPLDIKVQIFFLDKDGNDVGMKINDDNYVIIPGPTDYVGGVVQSPNEANIVLDIDQSDLDLIAKAKSIAFDLDLRDVDVSQLQDKGAIFPISISQDTKFTLKVALSAKVEAYLQLPFEEK